MSDSMAQQGLDALGCGDYAVTVSKKAYKALRSIGAVSKNGKFTPENATLFELYAVIDRIATSRRARKGKR